MDAMEAIQDGDADLQPAGQQGVVGAGQDGNIQDEDDWQKANAHYRRTAAA